MEEYDAYITIFNVQKGSDPIKELDQSVIRQLDRNYLGCFNISISRVSFGNDSTTYLLTNDRYSSIIYASATFSFHKKGGGGSLYPLPRRYEPVLAISDVYYLFNVCTAPQHQGRGYMRVLLKEVLLLLKRPSLVYLQVLSVNVNAISLYTRLGFTTIEQAEDSDVMVLELK